MHITHLSTILNYVVSSLCIWSNEKIDKMLFLNDSYKPACKIFKNYVELIMITYDEITHAKKYLWIK